MYLMKRFRFTESWRRTAFNKHMKERQTIWIGYALRGDTLVKDILEGRIKGKKHSRRPRCRTLDWMKSIRV